MESNTVPESDSSLGTETGGGTQSSNRVKIILVQSNLKRRILDGTDTGC